MHECWLRAADNAEANVWFNALHSALAALTLKALRLASALPDPPQLQHIGWLARRHCLQVSDLARFVHASLENRERKHEKMDILYSFTRAEIIEREICRLGIYYPRIYNYTSVAQFFLQSFSAR